MGDDVVSVAERAVDRIDVVKLGAGAIAGEHVAACRVVGDVLGVGVAEREVLNVDTRSSAVP